MLKASFGSIKNRTINVDGSRSQVKNTAQIEDFDKFVEEKFCGDFCKKLTGEKQRQIIEDILLKTRGDTHSFLKSSAGKPGEKRFLVSATWWRKWCDFANFQGSQGAVASNHQNDLGNPIRRCTSSNKQNRKRSFNHASASEVENP